MFFNESNIDTCPVVLDLHNETLFNYNTRLSNIIFIVNTVGFIAYGIYFNYLITIFLVSIALIIEFIVILILWIIAYCVCLRHIPLIKSIIEGR